jgi:hypothetical protein
VKADVAALQAENPGHPVLSIWLQHPVQGLIRISVPPEPNFRFTGWRWLEESMRKRWLRW